MFSTWICFITSVLIINPSEGFQAVRLATGGLVELNVNGKWGIICGDTWSAADARVVCRQLGLPFKRATAIRMDGIGYEEAMRNNFRCFGNESSITTCPLSTVKTPNCDPDHFPVPVGVICGEVCPPWYYGPDCLPCNCNQNKTSSCDPNSGKCKCVSGFSGDSCDCEDGAHKCNPTESFCHRDGGKPVCLCKKGVTAPKSKCLEFGLRLESRISKNYGNLGVYINGTWDTMCTFDISRETLGVICRQLGLPDVHAEAKFGKYIGDEFSLSSYAISKVECTGNESSLLECKLSQEKSRYCRSLSNIGVECFSECPDWKFGKMCENCICNKSNSVSCDKTTGKCQCKPEYEGESCDCPKGSNPCNNSISYCYKGTNGTLCLCKHGYQNQNLNCTDPIRLANMSTTTNGSYKRYQGILEMYVNGSWGRLCRQATLSTTSQVICKELGLPSNYAEMITASFTGTMMKAVREMYICSGRERYLKDCRKYDTHTLYCGPDDNRGIICASGCPNWQYGKFCTDCKCVKDNTKSCDNINGKCSCKDGYEGDTCSCQKGKHSCDLESADCEDGECVCKLGNENRNLSCIDRIVYGNESSQLLYYRNGTYHEVCSEEHFYSGKAASICSLLGKPIYKFDSTDHLYPSMSTIALQVRSDCYGSGKYSLDECIIFKENNGSLCHSSVNMRCFKECPEGFYEVNSKCKPCLCNSTNTVSCNPIGGACNCKNGFGGEFCNCLKTQDNCNPLSSFCSISHENQPVCLCKPGFEGRKLTCEDSLRLKSFNNTMSLVQLRTNDGWINPCVKYLSVPGKSIIKICERLGLPTFSVWSASVNVNRTGIETDFSCVWREFSTLNQNYSNCIKKRTRYYNYCNRGLGISCLNDCPDMMFYDGSQCVPCSCNNNNTASCNKSTGTCNCMSGYSGESCDCKVGVHNCNLTYTYCGLNGINPVCICRPGYYKKNLGCFEILRYAAGTDRLEMFVDGLWNLIKPTSSEWDDKMARVACRQMGLPTFYTKATKGNRRSYSYSKALSYVKCPTGNETELTQCPYQKTYYSRYSQYLGAECLSVCPDFMYGEDCRDCACNKDKTLNCTKDVGKCVCKPEYAGETCDCNTRSHKCNASFSFCGQPEPSCYCKDGFNNRGYACTDTIKLVKSSSSDTEKNVGRVEVYRNRKWNTFCDDNFNKEEGIVVCRQLNLPQRYVEVITNSKYGSGSYSSGIIYNMFCKGNETAISQCRFSKTAKYYCSHYEDISVRCLDKCPDWKYGKLCDKKCHCNTTTSTSCDSDSGKCSCKSGYYGDTCSCKQGFHSCNTKNSICHTNSSGSPICLCKAGVLNDQTCEKSYIKLENTTTGKEGTVLIFSNGAWESACRRGWNSASAKVVCKQLQLPWTFAQVTRMKYRVPRVNIRWFNFNCFGNESSLLDCPADHETSYRYCSDKYVAAVTCSAEPLIKLVRQSSYDTNIGLVQVKHNRKWGYICTSGWSTSDATVACRELGLPTKYVQTKSLYFTRGSSPTHLTYVGCSGQEASLSECSYSNGTSCYSYSRKRAGVSCQAKCPDMKYGTNCLQSCTCNAGNTRACDDEDGTCICKAGFSGDFCNCRDGYHGCNTTISTCHEEDSKPYCMCKGNATSRENSCTDTVRLLERGAVEVFIGGTWVKMCGGYMWGWKNSFVICKQLNLSITNVYSGSQRASSSVSRYSFAKYRFYCTGNESSLSQCRRSSLYSSYCSYETKVLCGDCPEWRYSVDCSKTCDCNRDNTVSCNITDGSCTCKKGFYGKTCSCKDQSLSCDETFSTCQHDRCICKEGEYNKTVSCSDFKDVIYFCTFKTYSFKTACQLETSSSRYGRHTYASVYNPSWRPKSGPYDATYLYVTQRSSWSSTSADNYRSILTIEVTQKVSQICVMFQYTTHSLGDIIVSSTNVNGGNTTHKTISGQNPNWIEAYVAINEGSYIKKVHLDMQQKTTIDNIIIRKGQCNCPVWRFGSDCRKCACVRLHTQSCNSATGACVCKKGYTGPACQCTENESPCIHDVRLVNGNSSNMGRVEVLYDGIWTSVCDSNWDDNDATAVCKQLGISKLGIAEDDAYFGEGSGPVIIKGVFCNTTSASFHDCPKARGTCDHSNDAGVICVNASSIIRLVGGKTKGRLEVRVPGNARWGTVCNDGFGSSDAKVACRQLGLPMRNIEYETKYSYGVTAPILMSYLRCSGDELTLQSCGYDKTPSCSHYEDISITCSNDCPKWKYGPTCSDNCDCINYNSLSCDKDTGVCICKSGWKGKRCSCRADINCTQGSYCDGNECICVEGMLKRPGVNCSGETSVLYYCSFEKSLDDCFIFKDNSSTMFWLRDKNGTPSSGTGPYSAYKGSHYIYTEATSRPKGAKAILWLTLLNSNGHRCLQFYYHMKGSDMGTLKIEVYDKNQLSMALWQKSGNIGSSWKKGAVSLKSGASKVKLEGIRGKDYKSDMALDHMTIKDGYCDCPMWKFGDICDSVCMCRRATSVRCNSTDGGCICINGWTGKYCDCEAKYNTCDKKYSYCSGQQCLCIDGQHGMTFSCSGYTGLTYFCSFESSQSYNSCMIHMDLPRQWIITEDSHGFFGVSPTRMSSHGTHLTDSRHYLKTASDSGRSMFSFSLKNMKIERDSCLKVKYGSLNDATRKLRIYVLNESGEVVNNILTTGRDWTTVQVYLPPMKTSTIYFIAYDSSTLGTVLDDIMITNGKCSCSDWYFGPNCNTKCSCNQTRSVACDNTHGTCTCKANWFGKTCDCRKGEKNCVGAGHPCVGKSCKCKDGYKKENDGCHDIDECSLAPNPCTDSLKHCVNTEGSFKCLCKENTFGDDKLCSSTRIALVNGSSSTEGALLLYRNNIWGSVCHPLNLDYALTGCKQLLKKSYGVNIQQRETFGSNNGITYQDMKCPKKATDLSTCAISTGPCDKQLYMKCSVCGGVYSKQFGLVEPPPYLGANTMCHFIINPPGHKTINMTFISFDLGSPGGGKRSTCSRNYVEVFDGPNENSPSIGRFCGKRQRFTLSSSKHELFIKYVTYSDSFGKHPFQVLYETSDSTKTAHAIGEACKDTVECVANNATCNRGFCACQEGFYAFDGATCSSKKDVEESCYNDRECHTNRCVKGKCVLNIGGQTQEEESKKMWLIPVLLIIAIVIIALVVVLIYAAKKMRWQYKSGASFSYSELMHHSNPLYGFDTNRKDSHRGSFISIDQFPQDGEDHRIRLSDFRETYAIWKAEENWPNEEFTNLAQSCQQRPCDIGSSPQNRHKNRDDAIIPYDFNRVRDSTTGVDDYINASIIEGLHTHYPFYIATQLPKESTQKDFWHMIWKQRASAIVDLVFASEKELYYPTKTGLSKTYGNIKVQTISTLTIGRCVFRCIRLSKGPKSHTLNHFQSSQLTSFHKDACSDLIELVKLVHSNSEDGGDSGPRVIHCWNGTGRTGVYIAMDYLLNLIRNGDTHIDIYKVTHLLINNRMKLIETEEQYQFIYDCVDCYLKESEGGGNTQETVPVVEDEDADLIQLSPDSKKSAFFSKKY